MVKCPRDIDLIQDQEMIDVDGSQRCLIPKRVGEIERCSRQRVGEIAGCPRLRVGEIAGCSIL